VPPKIAKEYGRSIIKLFVSNTTIFYYLTFWQQVSVIRPSSGILYIQFNTGYM